MRIYLAALILFTSGCVSADRVQRKLEIAYRTGLLEGRVEGFERGLDFGRMECEDRMREKR